MRIDDGDRSNVEDRRGATGGGGAGMKLGLGGTLVLLVLSVVFKQDMFSLIGADPMGTGGGAGASQAEVQQREAAEAGLEKTAVSSFNDTQRVWTQALKGYRPAKLVLFWDQTQSGCGGAEAAMGPFYCPADEKVYIDLGFYQELAAALRRPGRVRPGLRHRPRDRPPPAEPAGHRGEDAPGAAAQPVAAQRPLGRAGAPGRLLRRRLGPHRQGSRSSSTRATSRRGSTPPARSATTGSRRRPRAASAPTPSPTARRRSAPSGSAAASRAGSLEACDTFGSGELGRRHSAVAVPPRPHRPRHRSTVMRIAIPVTEGQIPNHFGHCQSFLLAEVADGKVVTEALVPNPGHGPGGPPPMFVVAQGVTQVLAWGMPPHAREKLETAGVKIQLGVTGDPGRRCRPTWPGPSPSPARRWTRGRVRRRELRGRPPPPHRQSRWGPSPQEKAAPRARAAPGTVTGDDRPLPATATPPQGRRRARGPSARPRGAGRRRGSRASPRRGAARRRG